MGERPTEAPGTADESVLVQRCRDGDPAAKRALLQFVLPTIRGAVASLLGAGADADDAAQQAAIDVLRGISSFRGQAPLRSWARTVAVRAGLKVARANRRHLSVADPQALRGEAAAEVSELSDRLPRALDAYLEALPPAQREALVLRHALGYTVPEVAELLGASVNTVKSRLLQARREVRRKIRRDQTIGVGAPKEGS